MTVELTQVRIVDSEVLEAFRRLLPQLSSSAAPVTAEDFAAVIAAPGTAVASPASAAEIDASSAR